MKKLLLFLVLTGTLHAQSVWDYVSQPKKDSAQVWISKERSGKGSGTFYIDVHVFEKTLSSNVGTFEKSLGTWKWGKRELVSESDYGDTPLILVQYITNVKGKEVYVNAYCTLEGQIFQLSTDVPNSTGDLFTKKAISTGYILADSGRNGVGRPFFAYVNTSRGYSFLKTQFNEFAIIRFCKVKD